MFGFSCTLNSFFLQRSPDVPIAKPPNISIYLKYQLLCYSIYHSSCLLLSQLSMRIWGVIKFFDLILCDSVYTWSLVNNYKLNRQKGVKEKLSTFTVSGEILLKLRKLLKFVKIWLHFSFIHIYTCTHIFSHVLLLVLIIWQWPIGSFFSICVGLTHFSLRPHPTVQFPKHMCGGRGISESSLHRTCWHRLQIWHWTLLSCLSASQIICHQ